MDAKKLNKQFKEEWARITPEERNQMDALGKKMEEMGMFYLFGECPKDNDRSTAGPKKD